MSTPKKKKAKTKKRKRPGGILVTVMVLAVSFYLLVTFINLQLDIQEKKANLSALSKQYTQQVAENDELSALINSNDKKALMERVAREKRGYVYPDERVYYDITPGSY